MRIGSPFLDASEDQKRLYHAIWAASESGTKWPLFEFIEDQLEEEGLEVRKVIESCPSYRVVSYGPLWWPTKGPPRGNDSIAVTLAGLAHCPNAAEVVDAFLAVVRAIAEMWHALPQEPHQTKSLHIRYADIAHALIDESLSAPQRLVDAVIALADREPPTWGGNKSGKETSWTWEVAPEVKRYRHAYSAREYLSLVHAQIGDESDEATAGAGTRHIEGAGTSSGLSTAPVARRTNRQQHAFISYVHEDMHHADRLQRVLEAAGIRVWRDTEDLWPGDEWKPKIREAITSNSLVFIACFSDTSVSKPKSYQREELLLAVDEFRQRKPGEPWLIPVRFSECALPFIDVGAGRSLDSLQRVDLFGSHAEEGVARLVATVMHMMQHQGTGDPAMYSTETTSLPRASLLKTVLTATKSHHELAWNLHTDLYVEADPLTTLVIPEQTCHGKVDCDEPQLTAVLERFTFHMPFGDTSLVQTLPNQVVYRGPGTSNLVAGGLSPLPNETDVDPRTALTLRLELWPAMSDRPLKFRETLQPIDPSDDTWAAWIKPKPQPAFPRG